MEDIRDRFTEVDSFMLSSSPCMVVIRVDKYYCDSSVFRRMLSEFFPFSPLFPFFMRKRVYVVFIYLLRNVSGCVLWVSTRLVLGGL